MAPPTTEELTPVSTDESTHGDAPLEASDATAETETHAAPPGPLVPRRRWAQAAVVVLAVLAPVLAIALAVVVSWWLPLQVEAAERSEVRDVARELALRLTTFEGERIEEWVTETRALSTGEYAQQVDALFDQDFRDALREAQAVSRGELIDLFVQGIDGEEATAFAVVRQTIANVNLPDPVEDELRMEIELRRVDGEWKVSGVAVLPSGGLRAAPAEQPQPAPMSPPTPEVP